MRAHERHLEPRSLDAILEPALDQVRLAHDARIRAGRGVLRCSPRMRVLRGGERMEHRDAELATGPEHPCDLKTVLRRSSTSWSDMHATTVLADRAMTGSLGALFCAACVSAECRLAECR
jgi:hypothetical protein